MKELIIKYKSVIKFILTFLLVYGALTFAYKFYLDDANINNNPDDLTQLVAKQTDVLLENLGYDSVIEKHPDEPSMKLIINGKYVARVVEGCNSVSVLILFASFVLAFVGKFKTTFLYILAGSVLLYVVNLFRIVILSIGLYHYPWRSEELHTVVFPLIIYGMVFLLWMLWVNRFSNLTRTDD
ncbi:exosortase family protein XrtF [Gelidibacter sp. F2691]|nr:exosortase family protein XrtF [Gelidibacter sp. F2691]